MNLSTLVRHARRRVFQNALLAQGANAVSVALGAFILMLLVGTQILEWQVAVLLPVAAAGIGVYLARKRTPPPYQVAQLVDRQLGLADALSTAFYFSQNQSAGGSAEIRKLQSETAERMAASADVKRAVPFSMPRGVYAMAGLAVVATSLFALRFGLTHRLDLQPPLARIIQQMLGIQEHTEQAKNYKRPPMPQEPVSDDNQAASPENTQRDSDVQEAEHEDQTNRVDDLALPGGDKKGDDQKQAGESNKPDSNEAADPSQDQNGNSGEESQAGQQGEGKADSKQDANAKQDANSASGDNSSLLSKMKDAMQNLLSKMNPQQNQSGSQQQSGEQNSKQGKGQQSGGKQQSSKDGQQQGQQGDPQDGQAGEQGQESQDQEGKGQGKNDSSQKSKQPGSGQGSHDGDKSIRNAQQLEAMGKISEIIGKRSANVTGEATVEVQSTNQQIRTPYAQRGVQHSQGGAEINRDEVPVALQTYVQQYFEQVRKAPVPAAPAKK